MSEGNNLLTLAFLDREPGSAARVLESANPRDSAAFLNDVPTRIAAPAIARMIPWSAACCIEAMTPEKASGLLRLLDYPDAVSILRLVDEQARENILSFSSDRFARNFRRSLVYPKDTVGAWMDVGVPSFQDSTIIKDAEKAVRRMKRVYTHIFLTNSEKKFAGVVSVADLYRHNENSTLGEIADSTFRPLSNRASLNTCYSNASWNRLVMLPVIGRKQNFLGVLSRSALQRGLSESDTVVPTGTPGSMIIQLLSAFITVCGAFVKLTMLANEKTPATKTKEKTVGRKRTIRNQ